MLTVEQRKAELWRRGRLRWKLYPDQQEIYDFIHGCTEQVAVINIARQFGKSFTLCTIADEFARKTSGRLIRFVAPTQKMLRKIIVPIFRELHSDCPADLRPEWNAGDGCWRYGNGSELHLAAANDGHADDSRGQRAHLCVVDEAGFVDDLDYLVTSVLLPQTLTTGGRVVLISTPPVTPAHAFRDFAMRAQSRKAYIVRTIDDNKHISEGRKRTLVEELGGQSATQARRELWCEFVIDETRAAVPEFLDHEGAVVVPVQQAEYFYPLVSLDVGFEDPTFALFGFWDYKRAKLCIQREVYLKRATTDAIAQAIKGTEAEAWPWAKREEERHPDGSWLFEPWRQQRRRTFRYSDTDLRLIADLSALHDMPFAPTAKDLKEAQVNELRMFVKDERIEIDPSCVNLIRHFKTTIWNKQRTQWERTSDGHGDGIDACLYMLRNAPRQLDPYPPIPKGISPLSHHIQAEMLEPKRTPLANAVGQLFRR